MAEIPTLRLTVEPETVELVAVRDLASFRKIDTIGITGTTVKWDLPEGKSARVGFADSKGKPHRLTVPNIREFVAEHLIWSDEQSNVAVEIVGFDHGRHVRHWSSALSSPQPTIMRHTADQPLDELQIQVLLSGAGTMIWEQTSLRVAHQIPATAHARGYGGWKPPFNYILEQADWKPRFIDSTYDATASRSSRLLWQGFFGAGNAMRSKPSVARTVISDLVAWHSQFAETDHGDDMAWDDMAVSSRILAIASALGQAGPASDKLQTMQVREILDQHAQWLSRSSNYASGHNHGLYADIALVLAGHSLPGNPYARYWLHTARERFSLNAPLVFDWDEGTVREHSPGYLPTLAVLARDAGAVGLPVPRDTGEIFEGTIAAMTAPDGTLAPIGDTWIGAPGHLPRPPGISVFPNTGWFAFHDESSSLFVQSGYHSAAHKHVDDGSPLLYAKDRWILFEVGHPGYERDNDDRRIGTSAASHNTVEFDDEPSTWVGRAPSGSGIVATGEGDGWVVVEIAPAISPASVRHRRIVAYKPEERLLIVDIVPDPTIKSVRQFWHLGPNLTIEANGEIVDEANPGDNVAHFKSWSLPDRTLGSFSANTVKHLVEGGTVGQHTKLTVDHEPNTMYLTEFSFDGPSEDAPRVALRGSLDAMDLEITGSDWTIHVQREKMVLRVNFHELRVADNGDDFLSFSYGSRNVVMPNTKSVFGDHFRRGTFYEPHMLSAIEEVARPGIYVDVRANIGNHSVFFEMFCPSTRVVAFEPLGYIFDWLLRVRRANSLSFEAHQVGLSDGCGTVLTQFGKRTVSIRTLPLDDMNLEDVAVIKIDIEGMEARALRGMQSTLLRCRPHLYIEAHTETELDEQEEVVGPLGYSRTGRVWNSSPTYEWTVPQ